MWKRIENVDNRGTLLAGRSYTDTTVTETSGDREPTGEPPE